MASTKTTTTSWVKRNVINPYTNKEVTYDVDGLDRFRQEIMYDMKHIAENETGATRTYADPEVSLTCIRDGNCIIKIKELAVTMIRRGKAVMVKIDQIKFRGNVPREKKDEIQNLLNKWVSKEVMEENVDEDEQLTRHAKKMKSLMNSVNWDIY